MADRLFIAAVAFSVRKEPACHGRPGRRLAARPRPPDDLAHGPRGLLQPARHARAQGAALRGAALARRKVLSGAQGQAKVSAVDAEVAYAPRGVGTLVWLVSACSLAGTLQRCARFRFYKLTPRSRSVSGAVALFLAISCFNADFFDR